MLSFILFTMVHFYIIAAVEIDNFEELATAFADKAAKTCNTRVRFVDLYAQRPEMAQYPTKKIKVKFSNMRYSPNIRKVDKPSNVYSEEFSNGLSVPIMAEFKRKIKFTKIFTWRVTNKASIQNQVEAKVNVPAIVHEFHTTTLEMQGKAQKSEEMTETFEKKHTITILPKTRVVVTLVITKEETFLSWKADIKIRGFFAYWFERKCDLFNNNNPQWLWYDGVNVLANKKFKWSPICRCLIYQTKGTFRSVRGIKSSIDVEEYDNDPSNKLLMRMAKQKPRRKYTIDL